MKQENIHILVQYINAMEEAEKQLEKMYYQKNFEGFNKVKQFMLEVKSKIDILLKWALKV